jgi:hypothetical protein
MDNNSPPSTQNNTNIESPKKALVNLLFNVVIPVFVLTKLSGHEYTGPFWALIIALAFPLAYGTYELISHKKWNLISLLGIISILLTGGLALLKLDGFWFAVKEAAIPAIIGFGVLITSKSKYNLIRIIILNPQVFKVDKIAELVEKHGRQNTFDNLLIKTNYLFVFSFIISSILNFFLAIFILKSPAGTEAFNNELGKMTALSFPVIMLPSTIILGISLWYLLKGLKKITGLHIQDLINN